jgi:hypothetical protein
MQMKFQKIYCYDNKNFNVTKTFQIRKKEMNFLFENNELPLHQRQTFGNKTFAHLTTSRIQ